MDLTLIFVIITTILFVGQSILSFMGIDAFDGLEPDFDGDVDGSDGPFQLFTVRNLIGFLFGIAWGVYILSEIFAPSTISSKILVSFFSTFFGIIVVGIQIGMFFIMSKFTTSTNKNKITELIGSSGTLYLGIKNDNVGKVTVQYKGAKTTFNARSKHGKDINTGSIVIIESVLDDSMLIVSELDTI